LKTQVPDDDSWEKTLPFDFQPEGNLPPDTEALRKQLQPIDEKTICGYPHLRVIGKGGMGMVYGAEEPGLHRNVAIKVLQKETRRHPGAIDGLLREGRMTAEIDHPNVVPVYRMGVFDDAGVYFSMRRINGKTLASVLEKLQKKESRYEKKYTLPYLLEIFLSVCNGVAFAHSKGIIHRDLKPSNIMLGKYGEVLVMDWGMACSRQTPGETDKPHEPPQSGETPRKSISGTPCYMAPEQLAGDPAALTEKTDQYALGAILYAILTLRAAPFDAKQDLNALLKKVHRGDFIKPRKNSRRRYVPRELEAIVLKAMNTNPEKRYRSVRALRDDVRHYLDSQPVNAYHPVVMRVLNFLRRHPLPPTTIAAALLSFGVVMLYYRIQNYTNCNTELKIAEEHMAIADMDARQIKKLLIPDFAEKTSQEIWRAGGLFENTRQHFFWHSREVCSALERAVYSGADESLIAPLADAMYLNIVECIVLRGDITAAKNLFQNLSPLLKHRLDTTLLRHIELSARLRLVLNGKTEAEISSDLPGVVTIEHLFNGKPVLQQLGKPPLQKEIPCSFSILRQKTEKGELILPVNLKAGELRKIHFEAPPVKIPGTVFIQKGSYRSYGDIPEDQTIRQLESFYIDRTEVTFGAYREFFLTLPPQAKEAFTPRIFVKGSVTPLFDAAGEICLPYLPDTPVVGISVEAAEEYCRYQAAKYGMTGGIPTTAELAKAARAVDDRIYPWGNARPIKRSPVDISPYGVCDLVTGVRELCLLLGEIRYVCFGGSDRTIPEMQKIQTLTPFLGGEEDVGFRCVYHLKKETD